MSPTFYDQQMWYGSRCDDDACRNSIQRGDIIVFDTWNATGKADNYLKRVISIPLDRITIANGKVYVNDYLLIEPYVSTLTILGTVNDCQRYSLGPGQIFVLGDNRARSNDSRTFGPVDLADVWGMSRFEKYNPIKSLPSLDLNRKLQVDEAECPEWIKQ